MSDNGSSGTGMDMFWALAGMALVILALCIGPASCTLILAHAK